MFLLIQPGKVTLRTNDDELELKPMQNLVGEEGDSASVEYVYQLFSDPTIDLVCDDEFIFKSFDATCVSNKFSPPIILCGNVMAVATTNEGKTIGLTQQQLDIVLNELLVVVKEVDNKLTVVKAREVYQS
ncbi:DUF3846 domain-containing protein [Laspinema olomoucense]|uniref:DUF3846 domain-containing protein n=1 Tax=Laspinema olomoucense D3b TaxID=2953688 RepID=A0ABT2N8J5_9CYAN|nr:DUF3846 domain-containing protein [Laspinema sp. D3b]MCT7977571.1 DUF3846 domain-containing protein [Laspinema sp. D3b]